MLHYSACVVTLPHCMTIYLNQWAVEDIWGSGDPWPDCCIVHSTGSFWSREDVLSRDIQIRDLWPPLTSAGLGSESISKAVDQRFTRGRFRVSRMEKHLHHTTVSWQVLRNTSQHTSSVSESQANCFQLQSVLCVWSLVACYYPENTEHSHNVPIWFSV